MEGDDIAAAVMTLLGGDETGQIYTVMTGRGAERYQFPGIPGSRARDPAARCPTTYDAHDPVEDSPRAAKHALVRAVKRLIELTAHLDVHECADLAPIDALTADVDEVIADRIEPLPSLARQGRARVGRR